VDLDEAIKDSESPPKKDRDKSALDI